MMWSESRKSLDHTNLQWRFWHFRLRLFSESHMRGFKWDITWLACNLLPAFPLTLLVGILLRGSQKVIPCQLSQVNTIRQTLWWGYIIRILQSCLKVQPPPPTTWTIRTVLTKIPFLTIRLLGASASHDWFCFLGSISSPLSSRPSTDFITSHDHRQLQPS